MFAICDCDAHRGPQKSLAISETPHCDLRVQWKAASNLRFRVAMSEPETPSFCGISGDLAPSMRKSLAIAIVRFWCAKLICNGHALDRVAKQKQRPNTPLSPLSLSLYLFLSLSLCSLSLSLSLSSLSLSLSLSVSPLSLYPLSLSLYLSSPLSLSLSLSSPLLSPLSCDNPAPAVYKNSVPQGPSILYSAGTEMSTRAAGILLAPPTNRRKMSEDYVRLGSGHFCDFLWTLPRHFYELLRQNRTIARTIATEKNCCGDTPCKIHPGGLPTGCGEILVLCFCQFGRNLRIPIRPPTPTTDGFPFDSEWEK